MLFRSVKYYGISLFELVSEPAPFPTVQAGAGIHLFNDRRLRICGPDISDLPLNALLLRADTDVSIHRHSRHPLQFVFILSFVRFDTEIVADLGAEVNIF